MRDSQQEHAHLFLGRLLWGRLFMAQFGNLVVYDASEFLFNDIQPKRGPKASGKKANRTPKCSIHKDKSSMVKIVIKTPIQLTMVSAEPTYALGANLVFKEEN